MSKRLKCPECGADQKDIRYVGSTVEYWHIAEVDDDGSIELGGIDDSHPNDDFSFVCTKCGLDIGPLGPNFDTTEEN